MASIEDNSCSAPAARPEHSHLIQRLDELVIPALAQATVRLEAAGFGASQVARQGELASMVVQRHEPVTGAWLYFQIHGGGAAGPGEECVFWMYAIHHPAGITASRPGRLAHLEEVETIEDIVATFVKACIEAPKYRNSVTAPAHLTPPVRSRNRETIRSAGRRVRGAFVSA